jgi:hypothetical protein
VDHFLEGFPVGLGVGYLSVCTFKSISGQV